MSAEPSSVSPAVVLGRADAIRIFFAFAAGYLLSYAVRTVNATLAPYLTTDLQLSAGDLGWLSSAYFIAFAALQWPLGFWLDRHGARRVEALLLLVAAAGAVAMALADTLLVASAGRILIGVGVSACLMAPFAYFRRCFAPERQAQLGLWILVAGTSGAVISTLPAGALAAALGWRAVFGLIGLLLLASALAVWFLVPDHDRRAVRAGAEQAGPQAGQSLVRHPAMLRLIPLALIGHGGIVALQTLWAGPWMTQVLGLSSSEMANRLFVFMLSLMAAYIALSFLSPPLQRRGISLQRIALTGHLIAVPSLVVIALLPYAWAWTLWLLLALAMPALSLLQPALTVQFPRAIAGRVLTLYNLFMFVGAFGVQWGIGLAIDAAQAAGASPQAAYPAALLLLAAGHTAALWWFFRRR